jgi:hypothetical protein
MVAAFLAGFQAQNVVDHVVLALLGRADADVGEFGAVLERPGHGV